MFFSKKLEEFMLRGTSSVNGLLYYVEKYIDPNQFAVSGSSCTHALIRIIDFILKNTDGGQLPKAVVNLLADWSKAFNKCNHNIFVKILIDMKIPEWLLRLITSYLEHRKMVVRFRGVTSNQKSIPGSAPQGTLLGGALYVLYINPIGFPSEFTEKLNLALNEIGDHPESSILRNQHEPSLPETVKSIKFMDDATIQETIDLNTALCSNIDRSGPLPFHESSGKVLPASNSLLQHQIIEIKRISDEREMVLNAKKTCIFIANFTDNHQFKPLLSIPGVNKVIETVQETKLLGYWLTSNMKPNKHIQYIVKRSLGKIWAIRRLKEAGASDNDLKYFYIMMIRSILETNCPVFHTQLTDENTENIERVQKIVTKIILSYRYENYDEAHIYLDLDSLSQRRENLCLTFALKCLKNDKHKTLFKLSDPTEHDFRTKSLFEEQYARTARYYNSPVLALTRILNDYFLKNPDVCKKRFS